jgi:hypothetical protein
LELSLFAVATVVLFASGDWKVFFSNEKNQPVSNHTHRHGSVAQHHWLPLHDAPDFDKPDSCIGPPLLSGALHNRSSKSTNTHSQATVWVANKKSAAQIAGVTFYL